MVCWLTFWLAYTEGGRVGTIRGSQTKWDAALHLIKRNTNKSADFLLQKQTWKIDKYQL